MPKIQLIECEGKNGENAENGGVNVKERRMTYAYD